MSERETWTSRVGFILAAVGSAVGLGNIWQFPFKTAQFGGASFLIVYLIAAFCIGLPAILSEFVIGRRAKLNTISAFRELGYPSARFIGAIGLLTGFWILSYYSVVGGWVLRYIYGSATQAYFGDPAAYFTAISSGYGALALHAVFMVIVIGIVAFGIEDGIEKATKVMVPSIVVILVALALWAFTLPGAGEGYDYYLSPDFEALAANVFEIIPFAVSQAFFSLSLGMGAMITYASYIGRDDSLPGDGVSIVLLNTFIGVLAGFVVFPLLFAQGIDPETSGAGAVFVSVASAFAELPVGGLLGAVFFLVVLIAALSSAISLLEVVVAYAVDNFDVGRVQISVGIGAVIFALGVPSALSIEWFTWFDAFAYGVLLPVSVALILLFVGWVLGGTAVEELLRGSGVGRAAGMTWLWAVRVVVLLAVVGTLALSFYPDASSLLPPL